MSHHNSLVFLKGLCKGLGNTDTLHVINAAEVLHEGQFRRGNGEPYISHPTMVTCHLAALGVTEDSILAVAMGHDILEDCDVTADELVGRFGIRPETVRRLDAMAKRPGQSEEDYYAGLHGEAELCFPKIGDRCHNVSTMAGAFTDAKIREYIRETEDYVIPLCRHAKRYFPQHADAVFAMKYQILALTGTLTAVLDAHGVA